MSLLRIVEGERDEAIIRGDTYKQAAENLKAERDALQARVKEAEAHDCGYALTRVLEIAERQLALAERRKDALVPFVAVLAGTPEVTDTWPDEMKLGVKMELVPTIGDYRRARAAIEEEGT